MGASYKDLSTATAGTASGARNFQKSADENGVVQVVVPTTVTAFNVQIQGRADASAAWHEVNNISDADATTASGVTGFESAAKTIKVYPQMQLVLTSYTGSGNVEAWFIE